MALNTKRIVWLQFDKPVGGQRDWFFGSIKAIFEMFNEEQIGRSYTYIRSYHSGSDDFRTDKCRIRRMPLFRLVAKNSRSALAQSE